MNKILFLFLFYSFSTFTSNKITDVSDKITDTEYKLKIYFLLKIVNSSNTFKSLNNNLINSSKLTIKNIPSFLNNGCAKYLKHQKEISNNNINFIKYIYKIYSEEQKRKTDEKKFIENEINNFEKKKLKQINF